LFRDVNDGFGSGCNYGSRFAKGKYLLFVNPDVTFSSNVNYELFRFMESDTRIGVSSPIYIEDDNNITFIYYRFPGYEWEIAEAFGNVFGKIKALLFQSKEPDVNRPFEVDWVMGSFMFIRANVFRQVNGFDENIFLYYEDIDLQFRIKKLGYGIIYYPFLFIKHSKRSSIKTYSAENLYYYHMTRSNLIFMYKHFSGFKRNLVRCFHILGIFVRIILVPFRNRFAHKRKQKLKQYIVKCKQYMSTKDNIFRSGFLEEEISRNERDQIRYNDSFWQR